MNLNQLMNMIFRIFVRKAVNKGINAGLRKATGGRKPEQPPRHVQQQEHGQSGNGLTKEQVRAQRRARRAARQNSDS